MDTAAVASVSATLPSLAHPGLRLGGGGESPAEMDAARLASAREHWGRGAEHGFIAFPPSVSSKTQVPEGLPERWLIDRTLALLSETEFDWQPYGPRLTAGSSRSSDLAAFDLRQDEQAFQLAAALGGAPLRPPTLGLAVLGPLTLSSFLSLPNGEKALSDHGAVRHLAEALADGAASFAAQLAGGGGALPTLFLSEPALGAVAAGHVPTASGWDSHTPASADLIRSAAEPFAQSPLPVSLVDSDSAEANAAQGWMARHLGAQSVALSTVQWSPRAAERVIRVLEALPGAALTGPSLMSEESLERFEQAFEQAGLPAGERSRVGLWVPQVRAGLSELGGEAASLEAWRRP